MHFCFSDWLVFIVHLLLFYLLVNGRWRALEVSSMMLFSSILENYFFKMLFLNKKKKFLFFFLIYI